jgi:Transglutaminase-like superfamily
VLLLALRAYQNLILFETYIARRNFDALYRRVRRCPVAGTASCSEMAGSICAAMDKACVLYWKQVFCLQRSSATVCLLRKHGFPAQLVIGAQYLPFKAHAWVEINGRVVNDKPYVPELYGILDRC